MGDHKGGVGPPRDPLLEAFGVTKKPRGVRRNRRSVNARGVTKPALQDEVGKRRLRAKRSRASRKRNR